MHLIQKLKEFQEKLLNGISTVASKPLLTTGIALLSLFVGILALPTVTKYIDSGRVRSDLSQGKVELTNGNFTRSIDYFNEAIQRDQTSAEAYNYRGWARLNINQASGAEEDLTKAINLRPNYFEAFKNRGIVYAAEKKYSEAISDFNSALAVNSDASIFYLMGNVQHFMRRNRESIDSYAKAIELDPKFHEAYYNRGTVNYQLNQFFEARYDLEAALRIKPDFSEAHNNLGVVMYALSSNHQNLNQQVIDVFAQAAKFNPKFAEAYCNIGIVYYFSKKKDDATVNIDKALQLSPELKRAKKYKNFLLLDSGTPPLLINENELRFDDGNLLELGEVKMRYKKFSV